MILVSVNSEKYLLDCFVFAEIVVQMISTSFAINAVEATHIFARIRHAMHYLWMIKEEVE